MSLLVFYGGTFDPIHDGHLAIARAARDALAARVRLMPAADPPHRAPPGASAEHRARMLDLAVAGEPDLVVDRRELRRDGPSYSVETLREIRAEVGPEQPLALLVGADSFLDLPKWREWQALFELAHFVVAERPGSPLDNERVEAIAANRETAEVEALRGAPAGRVYRLHQPLHAESASQVRQLIAAGQAWQPFVPAPVAAYIERHGLYGVPIQRGAVV
ncbi:MULTISPECIES: nicotinate-nucleotide adenylyltransferase [Lysobacter]|uniref:nicotinate-nucleotide adenylyltransferase n=1 Tax=Lysobacter TaxID=68 RepID=UPI001F4575D1|nr:MULTISPECIES: nicotinate-nucleotide adenylyltransferase [Lysobacter]UJB20751.1 nicotinate-nucleotide adenylyltransferase [Lysobacter capsici]UJQ30135.1 nicotinate-nucleotide adenylyltransferase [Lysobacter gummosus]